MYFHTGGHRIRKKFPFELLSLVITRNMIYTHECSFEDKDVISNMITTLKPCSKKRLLFISHSSMMQSALHLNMSASIDL